MRHGLHHPRRRAFRFFTGKQSPQFCQEHKGVGKTVGDSDLKEQIADFFDAILDVKERVLELNQENRVLKEQLAEKTLIKRDQVTKGSYKTDEADPLCPKCYQGPKHAAVYLEQQQDGSGWCLFCGFHVYAKRVLTAI